MLARAIIGRPRAFTQNGIPEVRNQAACNSSRDCPRRPLRMPVSSPTSSAVRNKSLFVSMLSIRPFI